MRMNLATRGLLLVCIPLIFELLFIGSLVFMLKQSQRETAREVEAKAVVFRTNRLIKHVYDTSSTLFIYGVTKSDVVAQLYDKHSSAIRQGIADLRSTLLHGHSPGAQIEKLNQIEKTTNELLDLYSSVRSSIDEGGAKIAFVQQAETKAKFQALVNKLTNQLDKFSDEARKTEEAAPVKFEVRQEIFEKVLWLGVPLSILIAVIVSFLFSSGITRRLGVLEENAIRFGKAEPLLPRTSGGDEIAQLDSVFHNLYNTIIDEQRIRQHIMAMVSHDLRSPIASLKIFLESLSSNKFGSLDNTGQDATRSAYRNTTRLLDLTADLLDFERAETDKLALNLGLVDLQVLCFEAIEAVSWLAEQNKVRFEVDDFAVQIQADERRLRRVLVNLLTNAIAYSKEDDVVAIKCDSADSKTTLHIIDKGPGISPENRKKVFDRFKQLEMSERKLSGGVGLGLAICKLIVESHGGNIGVNSSEGAGCDFWFSLPV